MAVIAALVIGAGVGYLGGVTNKTSIGTFTTTATIVVTTTSTLQSQAQVCISNINNPPQDVSASYVGLMRQVIKNPIFIDYSQGRCWTWYDTQVANGSESHALTFSLLHYTSTTAYSCSVWPPYLPDDWIKVTPTVINGTITDMTIIIQYPPVLPMPPCPPPVVRMLPVSFDLLSWNSSGQTVSLTLLSGLDASATSLTALIHNSTWQYEIDFVNVSPARPLAPGNNATQVVFLGGSPLRGEVTYDVNASGTYADGSRYSLDFEVVLRV
jgi:hypothetical protein